MIVDSSALIAILKDESGAEVLASQLGDTPAAVSAATLLEICIVARPDRHADVDDLVSDALLAVVPFDQEHYRLARVAHARFGRGSGSAARLNFGDCISYALAMTREEPLLFKGDDFHHTDVVPALTRE